LLFFSLRHPLSTTFLEVSDKNRKKKVRFFFLMQWKTGWWGWAEMSDQG